MRLSIITINYNNRDGLRKTIESVISQTNKDFEFIIIDGGSTDGSVGVIKEYEGQIDYWVSEPDKGVYNAQNKGTRVAHGEYCQYLNSGDWLYDDTVVDYFLKCAKNTDIILGATAHVYSEDNIVIGRNVTERITLIDLWTGGINHQSSYIRRALLNKYGGYDESYKICSDFKFWLQSLIIDNCTFDTIDKVIVYFDCNGISFTQERLNDSERTQIVKSLFPERIRCDYDLLSKRVFDLAVELHQYSGLTKLILNLDFAIIKIYAAIRRKSSHGQ